MNCLLLLNTSRSNCFMSLTLTTHEQWPLTHESHLLTEYGLMTAKTCPSQISCYSFLGEENTPFYTHGKGMEKVLDCHLTDTTCTFVRLYRPPCVDRSPTSSGLPQRPGQGHPSSRQLLINELAENHFCLILPCSRLPTGLAERFRIALQSDALPTSFPPSFLTRPCTAG